MMKKNKFFSIVLCLALLVSMLPAAAFAAPANDYPFTIIFGTKAYDQMALAKPELAAEIKAAFIANSNKFFWVKADKTIIDNFGAAVDLATLPKNITLKKGDGTQTMINEGEESLQVISISAITNTKVKVDFNKEVPHSKLTKSSFTILNKKSQPVTILLAKAETKEKKTSVTLTLTTSLASNLEPYTLLINKTVLDITPNSYDITIPKEEISIKDIFVSGASQITVTVSKEITAAPVAADLTLMDVTNPDSPVEEVIAGVPVLLGDKTKFTANAATANYFKAGKKYQLTVKPGKLKDVLGNINKAPVSYEFTMPEEGEAPKLTKATLMRHKNDKTKVLAVLEFDKNIVEKDAGNNADITIIDRESFNQYAKAGTAAVFAGGDADAEAGIKPVGTNQVVVKDIMAGAPAGFALAEGKTYLLRLPKDQVKTTALPQVNNKESDMDVMGVDVTKPTIVGGTLVSSKEIEIQFSEKVTYDNAEVTFEGFDATGGVADVVAKVSLSADGMKATLTPKNAKENFETADTAHLKFAAATFLDEYENEIANRPGSAIENVVDKAAPVAVKSAFAANKITITFTEEAKVTDSVTAETLITVGNVLQLPYRAAGPADKHWGIDGSGQVVAEDNPNIVAAAEVLLEAGVLQDAKGNVSGEVKIK